MSAVVGKPPWTPPPDVLLAEVCSAVSPPAKRMRAMYYLRTLYNFASDGGEVDVEGGERVLKKADIVDSLCRALVNKGSSTLIRHELAYVLGQIRDVMANGTLESIIADKDDDSMVRHECAEALGAIGSPSSTRLLDEVSGDSLEPIEVKETCKIAADFIRWKVGGKSGDMPAACACMLDPYDATHDPAPAAMVGDHVSVSEMMAIMLDSKVDLFQKYRTMFALRNRGGEEAVRALGSVLTEDMSSALFRHEIAFVLGQMQHESAIDALETILRKPGEHHMVRHEAAEALGAIEGSEKSRSRCRQLLEEFSGDIDNVVRESCEVALDAQDYYGAFSFKELKGAGV